MSDIVVVTEAANATISIVQPLTNVVIYSNKGLTGNTGPQGIQGIQGPVGAASTIAGPIGPIGPQGPQGSVGPASTVAGPVGPPGGPTTQYKGTWGSTVVYNAGDTVTYEGNLYWLENKNTWVIGDIPPNGGFSILLSKGPQGIQGEQGIPGNFSATVNDLIDVTITSVQNDDIIRYSSFSSQWVNSGFLDGGNY